MRFAQSACLHPPRPELAPLKLWSTTYASKLLLSEALSLAHDEVNEVLVGHIVSVFLASFEAKREQLDIIGIVLEFESFLS